MAVVRPHSEKNPEPQGQLTLTFNNGDFAVLQETVRRLGFRDEESMLRFALAVMAQAEGQIMYIEKQGKKIPLRPSADLLSESQQDTGANTENE